jgi:hypothetical protein
MKTDVLCPFNCVPEASVIEVEGRTVSETCSQFLIKTGMTL